MKKTKPNKWRWNHVILISLILAVIVAIANTAFSVTVRGGAKKSTLPDLTASGAVLQNIQKTIVDGQLFYNVQEGVGVSNIGEARSKASVLRAGVIADSLENVRATVSYLDSTGKLITSATTQYITKTSNGGYVDIPVDPLMPESGPNIGTINYYVIFSGLPITMPPSDGTVTETYYAFYGQADASSVITESSENNNYKQNGYTFRCTYEIGKEYPTCCIKRDDISSTIITYGIENDCSSYPSYHPLYS